MGNIIFYFTNYIFNIYYFMPQLDIISFYNQAFWLTIYAVEFYTLLFFFFVLPVIFVLKVRNKTLEIEKQFALLKTQQVKPVKLGSKDLIQSSAVTTTTANTGLNQLSKAFRHTLRGISKNALYTKLLTTTPNTFKKELTDLKSPLQKQPKALTANTQRSIQTLSMKFGFGRALIVKKRQKKVKLKKKKSLKKKVAKTKAKNKKAPAKKKGKKAAAAKNKKKKATSKKASKKGKGKKVRKKRKLERVKKTRKKKKKKTKVSKAKKKAALRKKIKVRKKQRFKFRLKIRRILSEPKIKKKVAPKPKKRGRPAKKKAPVKKTKKNKKQTKKGKKAANVVKLSKRERNELKQKKLFINY